MPPEIVYEHGGRRITFLLKKERITIGRADDNDLVIRHGSISRHHARIDHVGGAWRVTDLGSLNGTRVNQGEAKVDLRNGDKIFLHELALTFIDRTARGATLTAAAKTTDDALGSQTVFRSTVDFASLAAGKAGAEATFPGAGLDRLQRLLTIVTAASATILASRSLDETFQKVLDVVFEHLPVERGCIMVWDEEGQDLVTRCIKHKTGASNEEIRFSRTIAEKVYRDKVAVLTTDAQADDRFANGASVIDLGIRSAMAAPLWNGDRVEGLIYTDTLLRTKAFDNFDLDLLSAVGNHVAVAIEQSRLQQSVTDQQIKRRRLERYHSPAVVERITASGRSSEALVADEREVTVMFADVVGFTTRCETMEPRRVAELLNQYFSEMAEVVFLHEGTLDKYIGDCLMAVFGAPLQTEDHPRRAVDAALEMRIRLDALNDPLPVDERVAFRVGMHSGRVVAGDIGSVRRMDYTVLGATVNLAARLQSSVAEAGQIVISDVTLEAVSDLYLTRPLGDYQPKGISRKVQCFEVLDRKPT